MSLIRCHPSISLHVVIASTCNRWLKLSDIHQSMVTSTFKLASLCFPQQGPFLVSTKALSKLHGYACMPMGLLASCSVQSAQNICGLNKIFRTICIVYLNWYTLPLSFYKSPCQWGQLFKKTITFPRSEFFPLFKSRPHFERACRKANRKSQKSVPLIIME